MANLLYPFTGYHPFSRAYPRHFLGNRVNQLKQEQSIKDKRKFDPNWNKKNKAA